MTLTECPNRRHEAPIVADPPGYPTVLVVEDDEKLAPLVARALSLAGWAVERAETGDGALMAVRKDPHIAAVVLDIMIPHPDGIEVCNKLRRDGWDGAVVAVSALGSPDTRTHVRRSGADVFLPKPFHLAELIATLQTLTGPPVARPDEMVR